MRTVVFLPLRTYLWDVRAGEIIGIAGIDGNGQTELVQAITGLRKVKSGDITIKGESIIHKTTRQITEMSVGHIPEAVTVTVWFLKWQ